MKLRELERKIHEQILLLRSIENIIINPHFYSLWNRSEEDEQVKVSEMVINCERDNLIEWIKNHPDKELGEKNSIQLKKMAQELGIKNYSRMDKHTLITSIQSISKKKIVPNEDPLEMLTVMSDLLKEMRPILAEANIKSEYFTINERVADLDIEVIKEAYFWLLETYSSQYKQAYGIKKLLPQGTWDRYKSWALFGEHREVELLAKELKVLRRVFVSVKRPILFKQPVVLKLLEKVDARKKEE